MAEQALKAAPFLAELARRHTRQALEVTAEIGLAWKTVLIGKFLYSLACI